MADQFSTARQRRTVLAGSIGNVLEFYDFAVYGYLAAAIGRHFFPGESPTAQLLAVFGVFAVGYIARPLGGVLIGHLGDLYGRRTALTVSVVAMAVPTVLIGLLPGYATIGIAAPILLVLLRMLQGLSVGGEFTSSIVFLVERAPAHRRGFIGSFATVGSVGGILLGSSVAAILTACVSEEAFYDWAWRLPFLAGITIGIAGFVLRRELQDEEPTVREGRAPIVETLQDHWRLVLQLAGIAVFNGIAFHICFIYVASWLQTADGIPPARALEINSASLAALLVVMVLAARLSDRIGRKPVMMAALFCALVTALPLFELMHHESALLAFLGQLGFVVSVGSYIGVLPSLMTEMVPARIRCTAMSVAFNLCIGIAGGTAPFVAAWLVATTGEAVSPAYYIMFAAAVALSALVTVGETHRVPLPA